MKNSYWEKYERCADLMAAYKDRFDKNVPMELMFYDFDTISDIVEEALKNDKEIEPNKE